MPTISRMLRSAVIFPLILSAIVSTAEIKPTPQNHRLTRPQIQMLDDKLASLKPEYQADLTFELLDEAASSYSPAEKMRMIRRVYDNAVNAVYPYPTVDGSHSQIGLAHQIELNLKSSGLDALDIQAKAISRALPISPRSAQKMFERITLKTPHGFGCDTRSLPNVQAFYSTAQLLIRETRLSTVAFNEDRNVYITTLAQTMNAPVEIVPVARLIADNLAPADLEGPAQAFISSLSALTATDREMSVIENAGQLSQAIGDLAHKLSDSGISNVSLLKTYHDFLIRSLSVQQCGDSSINRQAVATSFNALIAQVSRNDDSVVSKLVDEQLRAHSTASPSPEPQMPIAKAVAPQLLRLMDVSAANTLQQYRLGKPGVLQPEKSDMQEIINFMLSIHSVSPPCPLCDYEGKDTLLVMMLSYLPAGEPLNRTIDFSVNSILTGSEVEDSDPSEWIKLLRVLLNISRLPDDKAKAIIAGAVKEHFAPILLPSPGAEEIKLQLGQSKDPVINAYLTAENILHLSYSTTIR